MCTGPDLCASVQSPHRRFERALFAPTCVVGRRVAAGYRFSQSGIRPVVVTSTSERDDNLCDRADRSMHLRVHRLRLRRQRAQGPLAVAGEEPEVPGR